MRWLLCVVLLTAFGMAQAETFVTKVIAVLDGDTVLIRRGNGLAKIRLVDIDAPEKDQPFGASSKDSLARMVLNKQVQVVSQATDQYGRMVARLRIDGVDVNTEQIRRGMAWEYSHYHGNHDLVALEAEARAVPRGLWAMSKPTPPWDWRKQHASTVLTPPVVNSTQDPLCLHRKRCAQMESCEEARRYLTVCGLKYLDADGDGTPCEKLCSPHPAKQVHE